MVLGHTTGHKQTHSPRFEVGLDVWCRKKAHVLDLLRKGVYSGRCQHLGLKCLSVRSFEWLGCVCALCIPVGLELQCSQLAYLCVG